MSGATIPTTFAALAAVISLDTFGRAAIHRVSELEHRYTDIPDRKHLSGIQAHNWSADGTRLLLTGFAEGASSDGIYICQPPAPPELVVANTDSIFNQFPAWSLDGTHIVFQHHKNISKLKAWENWLSVISSPGQNRLS